MGKVERTVESMKAIGFRSEMPLRRRSLSLAKELAELQKELPGQKKKSTE